MYPVYSSIHTGRTQNDIAVFADNRGSELDNYPPKKKSDDSTSEYVDEVRLNGAVRKILEPASGGVNSHSAAHLASQVASSDPALAKQAFGRIVLAVTVKLLTHANNRNAAPENLTGSAQEQDSSSVPPKFAFKGGPHQFSASDVTATIDANFTSSERPNSINIAPLRDTGSTMKLP